MNHAPQFITLTRDDGQLVTIALAHIVSLVTERIPRGIAHEGGCALTGDRTDECACPWTYAPAGTRINLPDSWFIAVREAHDDIVTLINARMAAVIDGAGIIARTCAHVEGDDGGGDPLAGWQPATIALAQAAEMCAELTADAARDGRMDADEALARR